MFKPHTMRSRTRVRGVATHSAIGAIPEVPSTAAGPSLRRLRSAGAATPTATSAQAVARMALEVRKDRQYRFVPPRTGAEPAALGAAPVRRFDHLGTASEVSRRCYAPVP